MNLIQGNVFRTQTTPAIPTKYWLAVSSTLPTLGGTNVTEPSTSGTGYGRLELTSLSVPTNGVVSNTGVLSYAESLTSWGVYPYYAVYDSQTGGNLLMFGALDASRTIEVSTVLMIKAGEITLTLANAA